MIHQMGQLRASQRVEVLSGKCCAAWHSLPFFNLRIRHSLGQSDTHSTSRAVSQPFGQSGSHLLSLSIWQFTRPKTAAKQVRVCVACCCCCCCCCSVCAALYDCNTFLRMSHAPLPLLFAAFCQLDAAWQKVIELL